MARVLVPVSCTVLGWRRRLLWREWVKGQSERSESTRDLAHKYLKMWVKFWILPHRKYWKRKPQHPVENKRTSKTLCMLITCRKQNWNSSVKQRKCPWQNWPTVVLILKTVKFLLIFNYEIMYDLYDHFWKLNSKIWFLNIYKYVWYMYFVFDLFK